MKRDLDLVRALLLKLEELHTEPHAIIRFTYGDEDLAIEGWTDKEIAYHFLLLAEAGLIVGEGAMGAALHFRRLTWRGHEYLDAVRSPEVWRKTQAGAKAIGGASVEFAWEMAKAYGKHLAKEKLNLEL